MWYYVKDNRKVGPVADVTLKSLYSSGALSRRTRVWTAGMKDWQEFESTNFFTKITQKVSYEFLDFELRTKLFRAVLFAYAILTLSFIYLNIKRLNYFDAFVSSTSNSSEVMKCIGIEYHKISSFTGLILFIIFLLLLKVAFDWIFRAVRNTSSWRKDFIISPTYAAWSIFIPVINLVQPFKILKMVYKYSKVAAGKKYTLYDSTYILLWWFFSLFALLIFILNNFLFTSAVTMDVISGILFFRIYYCVVLAIALFFWISFVSRVFKYQKKAFLKYKNV